MLGITLSDGAAKALILSTLAGLSTGVGGLLAILRRPDQRLLAALLGLAIGVMATLSLLELLIRNAYEHGAFAISFSMSVGAALYYITQPYFPDFEGASGILLEKGRSQNLSTHARTEAQKLLPQSPGKDGRNLNNESIDANSGVQSRTAELMRLGLLMAVTMTMHNLPEGFAVAFSSFTEFGPYMAAAIAVHNIPEGIIVAAPVYAATGSKWKSVGMAVASGLSEPLGALIALIAVKPFISEEPLHYILAFVGGIMLAVCCLELWPEARRCKQDRRLTQGCVVGVIVMLATLAVGI